MSGRRWRCWDRPHRLLHRRRGRRRHQARRDRHTPRRSPRVGHRPRRRRLIRPMRQQLLTREWLRSARLGAGASRQPDLGEALQAQPIAPVRPPEAPYVPCGPSSLRRSNRPAGMQFIEVADPFDDTTAIFRRPGTHDLAAVSVARVHPATYSASLKADADQGRDECLGDLTVGRWAATATRGAGVDRTLGGGSVVRRQRSGAGSIRGGAPMGIGSTTPPAPHRSQSGSRRAATRTSNGDQGSRITRSCWSISAIDP